MPDNLIENLHINYVQGKCSNQARSVALPSSFCSLSENNVTLIEMMHILTMNNVRKPQTRSYDIRKEDGTVISQNRPKLRKTNEHFNEK
jgi:hypothetical protein